MSSLKIGKSMKSHEKSYDDLMILHNVDNFTRVNVILYIAKSSRRLLFIRIMVIYITHTPHMRARVRAHAMYKIFFMPQ